MNLIHVTKFRNIESILKDGLKCSISKEEFTYVESGTDKQYGRVFFIPMVCFFGMSVKEHLRSPQSYGDLGIVFKKDLQFNPLINPVRYYNIFSRLMKSVIEIALNQNTIFVRTLEDASTQGFNSEVAKFWRDNLVFSKPFTAHLYRKCSKCNNYYLSRSEYKFGLEREWRAIPNQFFSDNFYQTNDKDKMLAREFSNSINIKKYLHGFVVKSKSKKKELIHILKQNGINCKNIYVKKNYGWLPKSGADHKCGVSPDYEKVSDEVS